MLSFLSCLFLLCAVSVVRSYVSFSLSSKENQSVSYQSYHSFPFYDQSFSNVVGFKLTGYLYSKTEDGDECTPFHSNSTSILVVFEHSSCGWVQQDDLYSLIIATEGTFQNCKNDYLSNSGSINTYMMALSDDYVSYLKKLPLNCDSSAVQAKVDANNNLFIVLVAVLSTIVPVALAGFAFICIHFSCRYCNRTTYQQISANMQVRRPLGVRKTRQLPVQEYLERSTEEVCVICREVLRSGDPVKILPCGHRCFHPTCINKWLIERNNKCPVCREKVRVKKRHTYSPICRRGNQAFDSDDSSLNPYLLPTDKSSSSYNSVSINFNNTL